jgi:U4/U6.U5 tri-snRNP component SNU23
MSTNLNYKQVANVVRRTWDVEAYEKRAQERLKNEETGHKPTKNAPPSALASVPAGASDYHHDDDANREEFTPAAAGATKAHRSQRAYLKARSNKVDSLDSKIGSVEIINPDAPAIVRSKVSDSINKDTSVTKSGVGWHCRVCDCFLRDSHTYLDHINGRKHQRNLGFSMRVERSTNDQVAARLAALVKEKDMSRGQTSFDELEEEDLYHDMVKAKDEALKKQQEERKRERKERRKKKKAEQHISSDDVEVEDDKPEANNGEDEEQEDIDPNLAAMMGFSGFGGGKNKGR